MSSIRPRSERWIPSCLLRSPSSGGMSETRGTAPSGTEARGLEPRRAVVGSLIVAVMLCSPG